MLHEYAGCNCLWLACVQDWAGRAPQLPGYGLLAGHGSTGVGGGPSSSGSAPSSSPARQRSAAADMSEQSGPPSVVARPSSPLADTAVVGQAQVDQTANDDLLTNDPLQGQDHEGENTARLPMCFLCICPGQVCSNKRMSGTDGTRVCNEY